MVLIKMKKLILLTFIGILTISFICCQLCGINPPKSPDYCGNYQHVNSTHRCCYCRNNISDKYNCLLVINNSTAEEYDCDCEGVYENIDLPGAPCLNQSLIDNSDFEITKEFCHQNSVDKTHPCCYYDDGKTKTCFSIGKIKSFSLITYSDFLDCFSNNQKINIFLLFLILFLILE